ncbi:MAG TPA: DPP IV N-terminal domain-containing protein, partial [Vicinamibacterales bacterium]
MSSISSSGLRLACGSLVVVGLSSVLDAQQNGPLQLTRDDYARAEKFMTYNTTPLVLHSGVRATWVSDDRFWYRTTTEKGPEAYMVDASTKSRTPCDLPECKAPAHDGPGGGRGARTDTPSPDGKLTAFTRDWNLWVKDVATGKETQLTKDGVKDYGYATDNAGWTRSDRPILVWSPDSKKIATFQQDQRNVGEMYLVDTRVGHPILQVWKYPLPGDQTVTMIEPVIIELATGKMTRLQMQPDQHRSTLCDDVSCRGGDWSDVQWAPDGTSIAFVSTSRDHKHEQLRVGDGSTGLIRDVLEEKAETFYESGNGRVNWRYLPQSGEVIWFSERDDWGHLYLHDLKTGREKLQITKGEGNVTQLLRIDDEHRLLYFVGVGKEKGHDPYFRHLYRVGMDGRNLQLLTPADADHEVMVSPSGKYFVDVYSKPDVPPVAELRDNSGALLMTLEKADISRLTATGWQPPAPITVKARDGVTDLYGLLYKPTRLDPTRKYP